MASDKEIACPKCKGRMQKTGTSLSSNSLFVTHKCMSCENVVTKCTGMLPEHQRY